MLRNHIGLTKKYWHTSVYRLTVLNVKTESPQNWSAGTTSGDFCIAPDPRELFIPNGVGSRGKGKGKGNGAGGGANVFIPRSLSVSELSGTGTCSGDLEFEDEDLDTWEELLAVIDLQVAQPGSRGGRGRIRRVP